MLARALELCIIDHTDTNNPFHWHHVQFNLPCTTGYGTSLPRVWLLLFDGEVVVIVTVFFYYGRVYGLGAEHVRSILRKICAGLKILEIKKLPGSALLEENERGFGMDIVCILNIIYRKNS